MSTLACHTKHDDDRGSPLRVAKDQLQGRYHQYPKIISDDYTITDITLGEGMGGEVKKASSTHFPDLQFAVKAFDLNSVPARKREQLMNEVEVFLNMDHPNVVRLVDVYESDEGHMDMVMECMAGGELFDRASKKKTFSEKETAHIIWQVLLALNYIHDHGIMHGDVKLENFMFDSEGSDHLKLIDFGFSKMNGQSSEKPCGTVEYIAPEVLRLQFTPQADMWSVGVMVFLLLTGSMPFRGANEREVLMNIHNGKYTMHRDVWASKSGDAINFTKALLQVDPAHRLSAAAALKHPFLARRHTDPVIQPEVPLHQSIAHALVDYRNESPLRRSCSHLVAWTLSNEERRQVRDCFIAMDKHHTGRIGYEDFASVLVGEFHFPARDVKAAFEVLSHKEDHTVHYSDFLAAMVGSCLELPDERLEAAFRNFDVDNSGSISVGDLKQVVGDKLEGHRVESMIGEFGRRDTDEIYLNDFVDYMHNISHEKIEPCMPKVKSLPMMALSWMSGGFKCTFGSSRTARCSSAGTHRKSSSSQSGSFWKK